MASGNRRWLPVPVAALIIAAGWLSGAITPHLSAGGAGNGEIAIYKDVIGRPNGLETAYEQTFRNEGWLPVTITRAGVPVADAYTLQGATPRGGGFPRTLPPGGSLTLDLVLFVTDCAQVKEEVVPIVFEVERWWGRATADVALEEDASSSWMLSSGSACE